MIWLWVFTFALAAMIAMATVELFGCVVRLVTGRWSAMTWSGAAASSPLAGVVLALVIAAIAGALIYHLLSTTGLFPLP
ncbi:MAG: hypothetical protein HY323_08180 [Betaproteobacteria bacterium]|nr:hypothetical protein [Betaproteobacteria bacterium]